MGKRWFDVTVTESYHATYKVLAETKEKAAELIGELVDLDQLNPMADGQDTYARESSAALGDEPDKGDEYWTDNDGETECEIFRKPEKGKRT